ncbi:unnamed protein product, partial [Prorocentrum cordatum]
MAALRHPTAWPRALRPALRAALAGGRGAATYAASVNKGAVWDPHAILGVRLSATRQELKAAYRRAALRTHPDVAPPGAGARGAAEQFRRVAEAYRYLTSPLGARAALRPAAAGGGAAGVQEAPSWRPRHSTVGPEEAERLFRRAFGGRGVEEVMREESEREGLSGARHGAFAALMQQGLYARLLQRAVALARACEAETTTVREPWRDRSGARFVRVRAVKRLPSFESCTALPALELLWRSPHNLSACRSFSVHGSVVPQLVHVLGKVARQPRRQRDHRGMIVTTRSPTSASPASKATASLSTESFWERRAADACATRSGPARPAAHGRGGAMRPRAAPGHGERAPAARLAPRAGAARAPLGAGQAPALARRGASVGIRRPASWAERPPDMPPSLRPTLLRGLPAAADAADELLSQAQQLLAPVHPQGPQDHVDWELLAAPQRGGEQPRGPQEQLHSELLAPPAQGPAGGAPPQSRAGAGGEPEGAPGLANPALEGEAALRGRCCAVPGEEPPAAAAPSDEPPALRGRGLAPVTALAAQAAQAAGAAARRAGCLDEAGK